ncbi:MAG: class IV adenylate cyclase [Bacteroidetes bacterium]|nr:class IV adenylate cyclase [Bacteroidota bacterium]
MKEIEVKIKLPNGFDSNLFNEELFIINSSLVKDVYYDNIDGTLLKQDKVLRLRSYGGTTLLAYKNSRKENSEKMIIRDEFETKVENYDTADKILLGLDYTYRDIVEKVRTNLKSKCFPNLSITIDKYPFIGTFMEIEGDKDEINHFLNKYNIDRDNQDIKNCTEAFLDYCSIKGIQFDNPRIHFTFCDEEKLNNSK